MFVAKLRKYLKTRRVTAVSQVGTDRIIEFQFSDGQYKLFLEYYAEGNVVLTDKDLNVIALLRMVNASRDQEELRVGLKYSVENRQNFGGIPALTNERVRDALQKSLDRAAKDVATPGKKIKKKTGDALRRALATSIPEYPPMLLDHALRVRQFDPSTSVEDVLKDESKLDGLMGVLEEAKSVVDAIEASDTLKGYIIAKRGKAKTPANDERTDNVGHDVEEGSEKENIGIMYEDFHPFRPQQFVDDPNLIILEFDGFNKTVDEFFSSLESQKLESRLTEREENAKKKLEYARSEHQKRLGGLQQVQKLNVRKAQAIEVNLQRVQEAIAAVNGLIAQGMDWVEIARLIEMEQTRQNPVASSIKLPLKLYENTITLLLDEEVQLNDEEDDEGYETGSDVSESAEESDKAPKAQQSKAADKRLTIDIDLGLSPWSNARQYYEERKTAAVKEEKTIKASSMALKSTEKKITADLKKSLAQEKELLRPVRKQLWFEKFYYFISSEGYLVLGGRDVQQSEILYKRYLNKGDIYVHADLNGATSVIVKNKPGFTDSPIPPSTLSQAGSFSVATSTAWDSKAIMAAWWVHPSQVSKTASNGDFLDAGIFDVTGKKNYLPPAQLLLGFGVMFHISDGSKARHMKHRVPVAESEPVEESTIKAEQTEQHLEEDQEHTEAEDDEPDSAPETDVDEHRDENSSTQYTNPLQTSHDDANAEHDSSEEHDEDVEKSDSEDEHVDTIREAITESQHEDMDPTNAAHVQDTEMNSKSTEAGDVNSAVAGALSSTLSVTTTKVSPQQHASKKHGKKSKLKAKYADQDEEDRELALQLLGSAKGKQQYQAPVETKASREAQLAADKERRREQHLRKQQSGKESEQARRQRLEEGTEQLDEDEVAELSMLDNFVGTPLPGDEILDCLAICAPWDAIGAKFRWRVKIQPGAQKKGKAVKEILGSWARGIEDREKKRMPGSEDERFAEEMVLRREGELIRGLRDIEVVGIVPVGKCRIMLSGGEKAKSGGAKGGAKSNRGGRGSKRK